MLFTCGESRSSREAALVTVERPSLALGHRPSLLRRRLPLPHPQVVKDVADKGDVADPALQGACAKLLPGIVLLLQPVEEPAAEHALACLLSLCL